MVRAFLDANVLFSAAYRTSTGLRRLWLLPEAKLCTSPYAIEEARRNLDTAIQRAELDALITQRNVVADATSIDHPIFQQITLPEKDRPILLTAVSAGATHHLTGDMRHFGPFYGRHILGVLIQPPAAFIHALAVDVPGE